MKTVIIIPRIKIHNANALSSPYTIGFPAMTAWLGWMHNLQRRLHQNSEKWREIKLNGIAVSCHNIQLHTHQENYNPHHIISTSNPSDEKGNPPPFIPEARATLEVTIALEVEKFFDDYKEEVILTLCNLIQCLKIASGDALKFDDQKVDSLSVDDDDSFDKLKRKLMPGYCLVSRRDLVQEKMQQNNSAMTTILDYLTIIEKEQEHGWEKKEQEPGWLVPIPIGYQGLTPLQEKATNIRAENTRHRFAESVLSLGEFIMPFDFESIEQLFWRYPKKIDNDLYLCENDYAKFI